MQYKIYKQFSMKNVEDVIKCDVKALLHFLKENHIYYSYMRKRFNNYHKNMKPKINTYIDLVNYILKEKNRYINSSLKEQLIIKNNFRELLIINDRLIMSCVLFASWADSPFEIADNSIEEYISWNNICRRFVKLKRLIYGNRQI